MRQEYMVKTGLNEVFFFQHSFKSARQHAEEYLERNKGDGDVKELYQRNYGCFGPAWILIDQYN